MKKIFKNLAAFLVMIAIGVAVFMIMQKNKQAVAHTDEHLPAKPVEVITVKRQPFKAHVKGYGNVQPAIVLRGKAEVSGKVSYVHPELKAGGSIPKGTVVLKIDPEDYEVSLKQTQADLASSKSQLDQLKQEEQSTRRSLELAKQNLRLGEKELERTRGIWEKRLIARSTLDAEEQKVIQLRQAVSDLQGQLNTYSSRKSSASAQLSRSTQQVKGQTTTLGRTEITMPFDARISSASAEKGEFVTTGTTVFEATSIDGVEISAEIPLPHMRTLFAAMQGKNIDISPSNLKASLAGLGLQAKVRLVDENIPKAVWDARVARFGESVDPTKRTLGVVVAVDKPYENVVLGERPPLLKGMFVSVELFAPESQAIVIPRKALHQERVYIVNEEQALEIRDVEIQALQSNQAVIAAGLEEGEQVIVNDLIPVIPGMPLAPMENGKLLVQAETSNKKQDAE